MTVRTAWVTGASRGIGRAVARSLHGDGYRVFATGRDRDALRELAGQVGEGLWPEAFDLTDEAAVRRAFGLLRERWGTPEVLVNSAGVGNGSPLLEGTVEQWRQILEVNVLGLSLCTRLVVDALLAEKRTGQVVHISSMSGHRTVTYAGMYAASKFAVQALTEGLRLELRERGSTIRVSSIAPGTVQTRFGLDPDEPDRKRPYPLLQADDVADAVRFILDTPPHVDVGDLLLRPTGQPR